MHWSWVESNSAKQEFGIEFGEVGTPVYCGVAGS